MNRLLEGRTAMSIETIKKTLDDYNTLMTQVENCIRKKYNEENITVACIGVKDSFVFGRYKKQNKYLASNEHRFLITFDELEN